MIRTLFNLTAVTALASPFALNVGASASPLIINSATALAGPLNINSGDAATGTMLAKYAPTRGTPIAIFWSHMPTLGPTHPVWADKSCWVEAVGSFQDYYKVVGFPDPLDTRVFREGVYNTLHADTFKLIATETQMEAKIAAHAEHDAQVICDTLYKQGLLRGRGPIGNGAYGGAWHHFEMLTSGDFKTAAAHFSFTSLLNHPDDAALIDREQILPAQTGTRTVKLYKVNMYGQIPPLTVAEDGMDADANVALYSYAGRDALEARVNGVRPAQFLALNMENGIAAVQAYVVALRDKVKALCDEYPPPGGGDPLQLCYPAYCHSSFEQMPFGADFIGSAFVPAGTAPSPTVNVPASYEVIGCMFHVRNASSTLWNMPLFYEKDANGEFTDEPSEARSYRTALEQDPVVEDIASQLVSVGLNDPENPSGDEPLHLGRIRRQAVDYAMFKALNEPWKEEMPLTEFNNYEFVVVKEGEIYARPSSVPT